MCLLAFYFRWYYSSFMKISWKVMIWSTNCYQAEKSGGRGIGGKKSGLCWDCICLSPASNLLCGVIKELGGGEVFSFSCNIKKYISIYTNIYKQNLIYLTILYSKHTLYFTLSLTEWNAIHFEPHWVECYTFWVFI